RRLRAVACSGKLTAPWATSTQSSGKVEVLVRPQKSRDEQFLMNSLAQGRRENVQAAVFGSSVQELVVVSLDKTTLGLRTAEHPIRKENAAEARVENGAIRCLSGRLRGTPQS